MAQEPILDDVALADPPAGGEDERLDEENRLKPEYVESVCDALEVEDTSRCYELVEPLHPADIADLFELLQPSERLSLATSISDMMTAEVVSELNDHVRETMVEALEPAAVADIAEQLDTDDAVQMLEDLDEDDQQAILAEMDAEDRAAIESALSYPEETAGRLMQREMVAVPEHLTVGELIDFLREDGNMPTDFLEVFEHGGDTFDALYYLAELGITAELADDGPLATLRLNNTTTHQARSNHVPTDHAH